MALSNKGTSDSSANSNGVHPVNEVLPPGKLVAYGFQHIAAMYAGVVAPPLIIGEALKLDSTEMTLLIGASLLTAGIATLLQSLGVWKFGARLPFVNGVTFGSVAPITALVGQHGSNSLPVVYGSVLVAGLLAVIAAPFFSRLLRFFPPVVNGTVITLIGLSLIPTAVGWIAKADESATAQADPIKVALAATTLVVLLLLNRFLKGFWNRISLLIGLTVGTLLAWPLGEIDSSTFNQAPVFNLPTPFELGAPQFDIAAIISICIVMLVAMMESTADMIALGEIVEKPADQKTISAGLRADGAGSAISAIFGGFTCSAFAQNIGLVALTKVKSRYVVAVAGGVLILLGLLPKIGAIVSLVPQPVLGGAGLLLFGSVAVSGIRTLSQVRLDDPFNAIVVAVSLGLGLIPVAAPSFYEHFPDSLASILDSGISVGCIAAVVLNLLFNYVRKDRAGETTPARSTTEPATETAKP